MKRRPPNSREALQAIYKRFDDPAHIHPDPLEWVHRFQSLEDREIAALVASSLAYGNVKQILANLERAFKIMAPSPFEFLKRNSAPQMKKAFRGFRHRWHTGEDVAALLGALKKAYEEHGSLLSLFLKGYRDDHKDVLPALSVFVQTLKKTAPHPMRGNLLPDPESKSACKRLNMFLRWMVRHDRIDTGLWRVIPASKLLVPLDTHMHKISLALGLTKRKQGDLRTVLEVTRGFQRIAPEDPVRYDFCLTRLGINKSASIRQIRDEFLIKIRSA